MYSIVQCVVLAVVCIEYTYLDVVLSEGERILCQPFDATAVDIVKIDTCLRNATYGLLNNWLSYIATNYTIV